MKLLIFRASSLTFIGAVLLMLGCPANTDNTGVNEVAAGEWVINDFIDLEGMTELVDAGRVLAKRNWVHDTAIDQAMRFVAYGYDEFNGGGLSYFWIWHKVNDGTDTNTQWTQKSNTTDYAGGGDTADYITMTAKHYAPTVCVYDSIYRWRWTFAGAFTGNPKDSGLIAAFYCQQDDTVGLSASAWTEATWTLRANAGGTLLSAFERHLIYCFQHGSCLSIDTIFPIDSIQLIYNNGDTNTLAVQKYLDFVNDTLRFTVVDTQRARANDTLLYARLKDRDGSIISQAVVNGLVLNPQTPKLNYNLVFSETP